MCELEFYKTESGRTPVIEYMQELRKKNKQSDINTIKTYLDRLQEYGPEIDQYYPKSTRKLNKDGLWELRPGGNRVFFFYYTGEKIVLLHAYRKQRQKAPKTELDKAMQEMKDYKRGV